MSQILVFILRFYKGCVSPITARVFGSACRFTPTCSEYSIEALERYGFLKGVFLSLKRLGKCHPLGGWGFDPVK